MAKKSRSVIGAVVVLVLFTAALAAAAYGISQVPRPVALAWIERAMPALETVLNRLALANGQISPLDQKVSELTAGCVLAQSPAALGLVSPDLALKRVPFQLPISVWPYALHCASQGSSEGVLLVPGEKASIQLTRSVTKPLQVNLLAGSLSIHSPRLELELVTEFVDMSLYSEREVTLLLMDSEESTVFSVSEGTLQVEVHKQGSGYLKLSHDAAQGQKTKVMVFQTMPRTSIVSEGKLLLSENGAVKLYPSGFEAPAVNSGKP